MTKINSPGGNDRALEGLQNEGLHFRIVVGFQQRLHPWRILVGCTNGDDVDVGSLLAFFGNRILGWVKTGFQRVVGVDDGGIDIVKRARQLGGIQFGKVKFFGFSVTSAGPIFRPLAVSTLIRPLSARISRARPPLVGSFGMAMLAPSFYSSRAFTFLE